MKPNKPKTDPNLDLFRPELKEMLDNTHPLYVMRELIEWDELHEDLSEYFSVEGAPAKSVQLVAGIFYLKAHYNLSDEAVVSHWVESPAINPWWSMTSLVMLVSAISKVISLVTDFKGRAGYQITYLKIMRTRSREL